VALWREALLAREVIRGRTNGYRLHPQLQRFRQCPLPRSAINGYLAAIHEEARARRYRFDRSKLCRVSSGQSIIATDGQMQYEWSWLLGKLCWRSPVIYRLHLEVSRPAAHPIFQVVPGPVADWERAR
jgi:hypothetical protein